MPRPRKSPPESSPLSPRLQVAAEMLAALAQCDDDESITVLALVCRVVCDGHLPRIREQIGS